MTVEITAEQVRVLREQTGAGLMECKSALKESEGDAGKAVKILREKGIASAAKKSSRDAKEGRIAAYVHGGGRIGVLLELSCETDFVARTPEFQQILDEISMQIAATSPLCVDRDGVPAERVAEEREILSKQVDASKPQQIRDKIVEGKLNAFFQQVCLLDQPYIREPKKTIRDYLTEKVAVIKENIRIRRFMRYAVGD